MKRTMLAAIFIVLLTGCSLPSGTPLPEAATAVETRAPIPATSTLVKEEGLIAYYPLESDLNDATGINPPIQASNAPLQPGGGVYCNGSPPDQAGHCDVRTPSLAGFTLSAFTISARFLILEAWGVPNPVFVGGQNYRWLFSELGPNQVVRMGINNSQYVDCSVNYRTNVWHQATITYDGQTASLYLDGTLGCSAPVQFNSGGEDYFLLSNYGNATSFRGLFRDLKIYDRPVVPAKTTPMPATVTIAPAADLAPVDQILARCPTPQELATVDAEFSLSFEADPTASQGLVCAAAEGSRDLTAVQKNVYNTLLVMKQLQFTQPLPWTSKPLYDWFTANVDGVRFRSDIDYSSCCQPARVINVSVNNLTINYTNRWIEPAMGGGVDGFLVLLVHEARHSEGHPHTCGTDDNTLTEMGAWGVQYYLYTWLADHSDPAFFAAPDADYRQYELDSADSVLHSRFCLDPTPVR